MELGASSGFFSRKEVAGSSWERVKIGHMGLERLEVRRDDQRPLIQLARTFPGRARRGRV